MLAKKHVRLVNLKIYSDRIAEGALQKFYKESTLLQQEYVKDPKKTIEQFLKESNKELTVTAFKRVTLNV